jgi:hypothetical protein
VTPPPVALIVTLVVPVVALTAAVNDTVTVHVGLHGLFPKLAVTPDGSPRAVKVTGVVTPLTRVAVMLDIGLVAPTETERLFGAGVDSVKSNAAWVTTSVNVAVWVTPPPVALIVTVVVEAGANTDAVRVTIAEHDGLQLMGEKLLALTPLGRALVMLNVTGVVTPDVSVVVAVSTPPAVPAASV